MGGTIMANGTAAATSIKDISFETKLGTIPTKKESSTQAISKYLGFPLGCLVFILIYYMPTPSGLSLQAQSAMACFGAALVWWIMEPFPTYATSLALLLMLTLTNSWSEKKVLGVLGLEVIWFNILAFILCSALVKTKLSQRLALMMGVKFGNKCMNMMLAFIGLHLILAPFIPATAARTVMVLPLMLVIAQFYGSTTENPNNVGVNLFQQNLQSISIFSSAFVTGSTCNIIAAAFIFDMGGHKVYYSDWMFGMLPIAVISMLISWYIGPKFLYKVKKEHQKPVVQGGIEAMRDKLKEMGVLSFDEKKAAAIFILVLFLWATDRFHTSWFGFEISEEMAALVGVVILFMPKIGLLKWNDCDIPWHVIIFSAGAYAGGLALSESGAARWMVNWVFDLIGLKKGVSFAMVYSVVIIFCMFAHLFFTSKTMRAIIMIPIIIAIAQELDFPPVALALPAAFTLTWVITLPTNAKPNLILYSTGQFTIGENLTYGLIVCAVGALLLIAAGFTWFRFLGITP
jgi:solute carrier family 13 (sodium-dependent dicarboxylate transporter), member 2/3/5